MTTVCDTVVVGAGQAGLAAGYYLQRAGLSFTILEAGERPAGAWPGYYDSLTLFSPARYSSLPGLPFPGEQRRYPHRDDVIEYLTAYAEHFKLPIIVDARVDDVTHTESGFTVQTTAGASYRSRTLIAATGAFQRPYLPQLPGQETFAGRVLHSAAYRTPEPFKDCRVVVVGAGNSATRIAVELAAVARVTLASRTPVKFTRQRFLGRDIHFWVGLSGVERLPFGRWRPLREARPVLDTGIYRSALAAGKPLQRQVFTSFTPEGVTWSDGTREPVDAVIFATGYRPNLDYLAPLGALDQHGVARHRAGVSMTTPGLAYVGLPAQRTFSSATLRGVGPDAAYIVNHLRRHLRRVGRTQP